METDKNILDFVYNFDSLKIKLVLYKDNPDLTLNYLEKETKISRDKLNECLTELIKNDFVDVKTKEGKKVYTLNQSVRFGFDEIGIHF